MRRLLSAAALFLATACVPIDGAGSSELEPLGAFALAAELEKNGCGKSTEVSFAPSLELEVSLSRLGSSVVWEVGRSRWVGTLDDDGRSFQVSSAHEIDVTLEPGELDPYEERERCVIRRIEEIRAELSDDERSFAGVLEYRYEPRVGSECGPELAARPPLVEQLPCSAKYAARAKRVRAR